MRRLTLSDLPEVFVPFPAFKANTGKIVYYNKNLENNLAEDKLLSQYNYITSGVEDDSNSATGKKIFFAERYGGDGMLTNGGGGRCGFDGLFHLKGLGPNQLVGARPRDAYGNSHGNGFLSLDVALYESIWGEILDIALPYGAVRTAAVIDLDEDFDEPDQTLPRGLLVRMPAVRPAHFIRALYFKEKKRSELSEDAQRVMAAVKRLVYFLPVPTGPRLLDSLNDRLKAGMVELAARYAKQFAAARAKKIFHQSISASNVTLEGAWMDLAGACVFSNQMWWEGFNKKQFTMEYLPAVQSIREMSFYLYKYEVVSAEVSDSICQSAIEIFYIEYERQLSLYNVIQAGFPLVLVHDVIESEEFLALSRSLKALFVNEEFSITSISDCVWEGYEHWASRVYTQCLKQQIDQCRYDFSWASKNTYLISDLNINYENFFELIAKRAERRGVGRKRFVAAMGIGVTRLNRFSAVLMNVYDKIAAARRAARNVKYADFYDELFENATCSAHLAFCHDTELKILFWKNQTTTIYFDITTGFFSAQSACGGRRITGTLYELESLDNGMVEALDFYRDYMEFLRD